MDQVPSDLASAITSNEPSSCSTSSSTQFIPRPTTTTSSFLPEFWSHVIRHAEDYHSDFKDCQLPLARIKKLVKSDPDVKMVANEVTVLIDKACEIFINEITVRAFLVANSLNRRTINRPDVVMALSQSDMFDFLIDIVPPEIYTTEAITNKPLGTSSTSTLPQTVNSTAAKKRRRAPPEMLDQSEQIDPDGSSSPSQAVPLPPAKKKRQHKVNRNLLPEEVAVPISDTDLIKKQPTPPFSSSSSSTNCSPDGRLLAAPIPSSELIPPKHAEPTWELAVPIISDDRERLPFPDSDKRAWDLAVPISDSPGRRTTRDWEMAVPILNDESSRGFSRHPAQAAHTSHVQSRNWDLAVPILDEHHSEGECNSDLDHKTYEEMHNQTRRLSPNSSNLKTNSNSHQVSKGNKTTTERNWELAVPIVDDQPSTSAKFDQAPLNRFEENSRSIQSCQSRSVGNSTGALPIDPILFNNPCSVKVEPDFANLQTTSTYAENHGDDEKGNTSDIAIKEEDS